MLALAVGVASAEGQVGRFARRDPDDCQHGMLTHLIPAKFPSSIFLRIGSRKVTVDAQGTWRPKGKHDVGDGTVTVTVGAGQAAQTVTTTIFENIFVDCSIERDTTKCTPVSTVTVDGSDTTPTPQHHGHGKNKGNDVPAPAPVAPPPSSRKHDHEKGGKKGINAPAPVVAPSPAPKGHHGHGTQNGHGSNEGGCE